MLFFFWRRRRRLRRPHSNDDDDDFRKAELPGSSKDQTEIAGESLHEAEEQCKPNEADDRNVRAELESDWAGWEAPTLLEVGLTRTTSGQPNIGGDDWNERAAARNSIQQTPVDMVGK